MNQLKEKLKEKLKECPELINLALFILGSIVLVCCTNHFFSVFAPFIIAYVITVVLRPMIVMLSKKLKIPNALATIVCLILFITIASLIVWFFGYYIVDGISYIIGLLSSSATIDKIVSFVKNLDSKLEVLSNFLHIKIQMDDVTSIVSDVAKNIISKLSTLSLSIVSEIPNFIIAFVIGCVAAFYMLFDYDKVSGAIKKQLSEKTKRFVSMFNNRVIISLIKMSLSYIVLSIICFFELIVGFKILGIKDAAFMALLIAIFDVLPVVGSGGILVPWGVVSFILGNIFVGIGLIVLWILIVVVRQTAEPKIVGSQIGLHPLITVATLYIGLKLMGGVGLIVAPLYVVVCKELNEEGFIHLYQCETNTIDTKNENNKAKTRQRTAKKKKRKKKH